MTVSAERAARKQAFVEWLMRQHTEQVSAAAAAFLSGKPVCVSYDPAGADASCLVVAVIDAGALRIVDVEHGS